LKNKNLKKLILKKNILEKNIFFEKFSKVRHIWVWPMKQWNNRRIENLFLKIKI